MPLVIGIDPGPRESALVGFDGNQVINPINLPNWEVKSAIQEAQGAYIACELIESFGMAVGKSTFETCRWTGFFEAWAYDQMLHFLPVYRKEVKMHLCHSMRAKDTNITQALLDRFPATGGGKKPQVGTKKQPGPLYGVSNHLWSALAVAVTAYDRLDAGKEKEGRQ